jgi:hypothetical protein
MDMDLAEFYGNAIMARAKAEVDEREALEVARLAAVLATGQANLHKGTLWVHVENARLLLAEARKQVDKARAERERS